MKRATILLALVAVLTLVGQALAMSSPRYRLDWFVPLAGGADGLGSSTHYAVDSTLGQSATGTAASSHYRGCLGYWCGADVGHRVYLPLVVRNH